MNKVIWLCWLQGWDNAPWLVRKCLASWQFHNPGWTVHALDARSMQRFIELPDLSGKEITSASMSDIVRIHLLHEYGGVWTDTTVCCHRPLDDWLPGVMKEGFFAFDRPGPGRMLASWFLAADEGNPILDRWHAEVLQFWRRNNDGGGRYFWFHERFGHLYDSDPEFARTWDRVPKLSADAAHRLQSVMLEDSEVEVDVALLTLPPVSKLTYRLDESRATEKSLVSRLLAEFDEPVEPPREPRISPTTKPRVSLSVSTQNLGDHIQLIAARRLVERTWPPSDIHVDRDDEIGSCPGLDPAGGPYPILVNGWFKTNGAEWPPSPALDPIFFGFHIRRHQCPELLSEPALEHYRRHAPIGCRDTHTLDLLRDHGVSGFLSNCLSLSLPRRTLDAASQTTVFVVSRDDRIMATLPASLAGAEFVCHYVSERDFEQNMLAAEKLLDTYASSARLIVTTLLHCALPAIAMGIPVVVFYPANDEFGQASDRERFSTLATMVPVHEFGATEGVDWNPEPVRVAAQKLALVDAFHRLAKRWQLPFRERLCRLAPSSALPPPC